MTAPSETELPTPGPTRRLARFDVAERALHWANAALFGVLLATAALLYVGQLSALVGRRELVRHVHVVCGLLLPVPLFLALAGPWRRSVLADLRALNRFDGDDRRWLRSRGRDISVRLGKFNPGQKLNAAFVAGAIGVMLATGSIMFWFAPFPLAWRTGATFVHDWTAIAVGLVVAGHIWMAVGDGDSLRSMVRGWVPAWWAEMHRPRWYEQVTGLAAATEDDERRAPR
ncbi:MAG TPA: cytochrome b/b6 domain-containing protein [Acidimicrobiales bacterium]|jgi:formate dehydrogenase subunit gamma|nr:cytochrome b/b6 domain-containing protein [Acidimicrobiales bacterium]